MRSKFDRLLPEWTRKHVPDWTSKKVRHASIMACATAAVAGWTFFVDKETGAPAMGALLLTSLNTYTGPNPSPTLAFDIVRVDDVLDTEMVEGVVLWLQIANVVGAKGWDNEDITAPTPNTRAYDPVAHMTEAYWDFGQAAYTSLVTANVPVQWRDRNKDEGHLVSFVARAGTPTVTCLLFDSQGNWGSKTYSVPTIAAQDDYFDGTKTACFSIDNDFSEKPNGATQCTTAAQVNSWASSNAGAGLRRLMLRRGETYNVTEFGELRTFLGLGGGLFISAYGTGPEPIVHCRWTSGDEGGIVNVGGMDRPCLVSNLDLRGDWDSTKEIGVPTSPFWSQNSMGCRTLTFWRCKVSGMSQIEMNRSVGVSARYRNFHDVEVTNWRVFGIYGGTTYQSFVGCRIHQSALALNGINQGINRNDPTDLGNEHGCIRLAGNSAYTHLRGSSFFSRNGWSSAPNRAWTTTAPTVEQSCIRMNTVPSGFSTGADLHNWSCCYFEGGAGDGNVQLSGNGFYDNGTHNIIWSNMIMVAGSQVVRFTQSPYMGVTFRNIYAVLTDINLSGGGEDHPAFQLNGDNSTIYNSTLINLRATTAEGADAPGFVVSGTGSRTAHNVFYGPNATPAEGDDLPPFSNDVFNGVVLFGVGQRWNFPPIGAHEGSTLHPSFVGPIKVGDVREGGTGNVINGEWIALDYPDYSGFCRGSNPSGPLGQVTRAICESNSTQFHQLSITNGDKRMSPSVTGTVPGNGQILVEFTDTKIRIQKKSGDTWLADGDLWFMLDLSDYLMEPRADTGHAGQTLRLYAPQSGSAAWIGDWSAGPFSRKDILGNIRPDGLSDSGVAQSGQRAAGAFAP